MHFRALSEALHLAGSEGIRLGFPNQKIALAQGIPYPYSYYIGCPLRIGKAADVVPHAVGIDVK